MAIYSYYNEDKIGTVITQVTRDYITGERVDLTLTIDDGGYFVESIGNTVQLRERNYYDDSDFYAIMYHAPTDSFVEMFDGTTRFAAPPRAHADASDEVFALYRERLTRQSRRNRAIELLELRARMRRHREEAGLSWGEYNRLTNAVGDESFENLYLPLLRSDHANRLRSDFRKSLASRVREWLATPDSKYRTPLSFRQESYLY